jgi:hypothetical protein
VTKRIVVACTLVVVAAIAVVIGQTKNPEVGTWKLNPAKSKYAAGTALKSGTAKIEPAGAGIKTTMDTVNADGTSRHWEFTASYDGKDVSIMGNSRNGDMVALTRVDANTFRAVYKKGGKTTLTQTTVFSADGKTRTVTSKGTNALGQTIDSVGVWERE